MKNKKKKKQSKANKKIIMRISRDKPSKEEKMK